MLQIDLPNLLPVLANVPRAVEMGSSFPIACCLLAPSLLVLKVDSLHSLNYQSDRRDGGSIALNGFYLKGVELGSVDKM